MIPFPVTLIAPGAIAVTALLLFLFLVAVADDVSSHTEP